MFERTVSFWRRLVGSTPRRPAPDGEDRRVWVRYPAEVETTGATAAEGGKPRFSAVVRNISVGGLNLAADREFVPGDLLTVELPGPTGQSTCTVLACVVHVRPDGEGQWSVGCTFARELTAEDLAPFGARRERAEGDKRTWVRYACDVKANYQFVAFSELARRPAQVLNISASGVGLLVDHAVDTGTLLSVDLLSATGQSGKTMLSCVVHVTKQAESEWALGCNFITELSEQDLKELCGAPAPATAP
jgi:hypothetical protein